MHQQPISAPSTLPHLRSLPDVFATIGIALGIGNLISWVLLPILWPLTLAGIIGGLAFSLLRLRSRQLRGQALAGLICSSIAFPITILGIIWIFSHFY